MEELTLFQNKNNELFLGTKRKTHTGVKHIRFRATQFESEPSSTTNVSAQTDVSRITLDYNFFESRFEDVHSALAVQKKSIDNVSKQLDILRSEIAHLKNVVRYADKNNACRMSYVYIAFFILFAIGGVIIGKLFYRRF